MIKAKGSANYGPPCIYTSVVCSETHSQTDRQTDRHASTEQFDSCDVTHSQSVVQRPVTQSVAGHRVQL